MRKAASGPGYSSAAASSRKLARNLPNTHSSPARSKMRRDSPCTLFHQITTVQELEISAGMLLFLCSRAHRYERNTSYAFLDVRLWDL